MVSSQTGLAFWCEVRCSVGFQPFEAASRSQATLLSRPSAPADGDAAQRLAAARGADDRAQMDGRADLPCECLQPGIDLRPCIDDRRDACAGPGEVARRCPAMVARREHHRVPPRQHAVAVEIGPDRARQHDPGRVVAGEDRSAARSSLPRGSRAWRRSARNAGGADAPAAPGDGRRHARPHHRCRDRKRRTRWCAASA